MLFCPNGRFYDTFCLIFGYFHQGKEQKTFFKKLLTIQKLFLILQLDFSCKKYE